VSAKVATLAGKSKAGLWTQGKEALRVVGALGKWVRETAEEEGCIQGKWALAPINMSSLMLALIKTMEVIQEVSVLVGGAVSAKLRGRDKGHLGQGRRARAEGDLVVVVITLGSM